MYQMEVYGKYKKYKAKYKALGGAASSSMKEKLLNDIELLKLGEECGNIRLELNDKSEEPSIDDLKRYKEIVIECRTDELKKGEVLVDPGARVVAQLSAAATTLNSLKVIQLDTLINNLSLMISKLSGS